MKIEYLPIYYQELKHGDYFSALSSAGGNLLQKLDYNKYLILVSTETNASGYPIRIADIHVDGLVHFTQLQLDSWHVYKVDIDTWLQEMK